MKRRDEPRCECDHSERHHDAGPCRGGAWHMDTHLGDPAYPMPFRMLWYRCTCPEFVRRPQAGGPRISIDDHLAYVASFDASSSLR